jgi:hypothetical protein
MIPELTTHELLRPATDTTQEASQPSCCSAISEICQERDRVSRRIPRV